MTPSATFKWKMKPRAFSWHNAWDDRAGRYHDDYVNPTRFRIALDARGSKSGAERIASYTWTVRGLDDPGFQPPALTLKERKVPGQPKPPPKNVPSHKVDIILDDDKLLAGRFIPPSPDAEFELPGLGRYRVTLKVANEKRQSASATQDITLRDELMVSLGDSMASGEGTPDIPGKGDLLDLAIDLPDVVNADRDVIWTDRRCHRSIFAGHALAAQALEAANTRRTITFLSFACSGARIGEGVLREYGGIERPSGASRLPAQLEALNRAVGDSRRIDHLVITAGINDLGIGASSFASIIIALADPRADMVKSAKRAVTGKLPMIGRQYDLLAYTLSRTFHGRVGQVYLTGYPADIFHDDEGERGGCGLLFDVGESEAEFLAEKGREFNSIIEEAARRHGWVFVGGLTEKFDGHGYCCDEPWYVALSDSAADQLNVDGTIHPNRKGHRAIGEQIAVAVRATRVQQRQPKRVTVRFSTVRVVDTLDDGEPGVEVPRQPVPVTLWLNGQGVQTDPLPLGREVDLPEDAFTVSAIVANGLANVAEVRATAVLRPRVFEGPRPEPDDSQEAPASVRRDLQTRAVFEAAENYGSGTHTGRASLTDGSLEVTYRLTVQPVDGFKPGGTIGEPFPGGVFTEQEGGLL